MDSIHSLLFLCFYIGLFFVGPVYSILVTIPSGVTTIRENEFFNKGLTSLSFESPSYVTTIEAWAFGFNSLTSVEIPSSVITIGFSAFVRNQLKNVTISSNVTTIAEQAFITNPLTSLTFESPSRVTSIGRSAFIGTQLTSVEIPASLTTIESYVFASNQLTSVTFQIPSNLILINRFAFTTNPLTEVTIPSGISYHFQAFDSSVRVIRATPPPTPAPEPTPEPTPAPTLAPTPASTPAPTLDPTVCKPANILYLDRVIHDGKLRLSWSDFQVLQNGPGLVYANSFLVLDYKTTALACLEETCIFTQATTSCTDGCMYRPISRSVGFFLSSSEIVDRKDVSSERISVPLLQKEVYDFNSITCIRVQLNHPVDLSMINNYTVLEKALLYKGQYHYYFPFSPAEVLSDTTIFLTFEHGTLDVFVDVVIQATSSDIICPTFSMQV
jgi:hypothetical protein